VRGNGGGGGPALPKTCCKHGERERERETEKERETERDFKAFPPDERVLVLV
jgi:hypothetical protein